MIACGQSIASRCFTILYRSYRYSASGFGRTVFRVKSFLPFLALLPNFWTSTMRGSDVWRRRVAAATPGVFRFTNPPSTFAISVRCVGD